MDTDRLKSVGTISSRYLNLNTKFKSQGTIRKDDFRSTPCFAKALKTGFETMDNTYEIFIWKDRQHDDNFLYFTKDEILEYIGYVKEIYDNFTFDIIEDVDEHMILKVHINDSHVYHTFVLTCIRYLYEFTYAIMLNDAIMLKRSFRFKDYNIISLMALVWDSMREFSAHSSPDMSHFPYCSIILPISKDEYKKRLEYIASKTKRYESGETLPFKAKYDYDVLFMPLMTNIFPFILREFERTRNYTKLKELCEKVKQVDPSPSKLPSTIGYEEFQKYSDDFVTRYKVYRENISIIWDIFEDSKGSIKDLIEDNTACALYDYDDE